MNACVVMGRIGVDPEGGAHLQAAHWVERFEHPSRLVLQLWQHAGEWHEPCTFRLLLSVASMLWCQRSLHGTLFP